MNIAIVASTFNPDIVERLVRGAEEFFEKQAQKHDTFSYKIFRVPGALELPAMVKRLAVTKRFDGIIALGCVIKGETDHYQAVCEGVTFGLQQASLAIDVPVMNGILMCTEKSQAVERSKPHDNTNKGYECAEGCMQMVALFKQNY